MNESIDAMTSEEFTSFLDRFRKDVKPFVNSIQFKEDVFEELKDLMKWEKGPDENGDEE